MKYIDADKLIAEIERYKQESAIARFDNAGENADYFQGKVDLCNDLTHIIASLQQEQPEVGFEKEPTIKGWVARDECRGDESDLYIGVHRPSRIDNAAPGFGMWCNYGEFMALPSDMFLDLKWEDEPIEVELEIHRV